jgi:hypothetical protein
MSRSLESSVFCLFLHSVFCLCCCLLWLFRLVASPPCFYSHFGEPLRLCVGWGQKEKSMLPVFGRPTDRPDGRRDVEQRVKQRDNSCSIYCFLQLEGRFLQACSAVTTLKAKVKRTHHTCVASTIGAPTRPFTTSTRSTTSMFLSRQFHPI